MNDQVSKASGHCEPGIAQLACWLDGKLAQATGFQPAYCADLCLPGESHISTPAARQGSRRRREAVGLSVLQWMRLGTCETASQGGEQKRKASQDWYPEPHVTASQAACEVTLLSSIQTTSGAKALSRLFSAVSHPLSTWCQF